MRSIHIRPALVAPLRAHVKPTAPPLTDGCSALLRSGQAIPQEALRYDVLAARFNGQPRAGSLPYG
jgi:hypothetical protein